MCIYIYHMCVCMCHYIYSTHTGAFICRESVAHLSCVTMLLVFEHNQTISIHDQVTQRARPGV